MMTLSGITPSRLLVYAFRGILVHSVGQCNPALSIGVFISTGLKPVHFKPAAKKLEQLVQGMINGRRRFIR